MLPALVMLRYDVPDSLGLETITIAELPESWKHQESLTQQRGDQWHATLDTPLLRVPSVVIPLDDSPDMNVLINHQHPAAAEIRTIAADAFVLDGRLL